MTGVAGAAAAHILTDLSPDAASDGRVDPAEARKVCADVLFTIGGFALELFA